MIDQTISSPSSKLVGVGHFGKRVPYGFHHLKRWFILVVEPSPSFRNRSLAADCPILWFF